MDNNYTFHSISNTLKKKGVVASLPAKVKRVKKQKKDGKNRTEIKKEKSKIVIFLCIILILLLGMLVGISFSKYQRKITAKGLVSIAKPVLEVRKEQSLLVTALNPKAVYCFEVRNYKEEEINEVEMEYYIEIINPIGEELEFTLYEGEKQVPMIGNKTEKIRLTKEEIQIHSYRLEMTYQKEKSTKEENINEEVEIKIHSIQKA